MRYTADTDHTGRVRVYAIYTPCEREALGLGESYTEEAGQ
jgi:hypothetical protein